MKMIYSLFAAILFSISANAAGLSTSRYSSVANEEKAGQFGAGLAVGSLTGLSTQYWLDNGRAINATFAAERGNVALSVAHLWLFRGAFANTSRRANDFVPYIGIGAIAAFGTQSDYFTRNNENVAVAAQVPFGIEFLPSLQRFDIFAELAPSLEIVPTTGGFLTADLGARFYF
jgi:hypothetical protein